MDHTGHRSPESGRCYLHLTEHPVQEVCDVAINSRCVLLVAAVPPNVDPHEPPRPMCERHQQGGAVSRLKDTIPESNWFWSFPRAEHNTGFVLTRPSTLDPRDVSCH